MQVRGEGSSLEKLEHTYTHQVHTQDLSVCFQKGNQATSCWPRPLVVELSGNCALRLLTDSAGSCLSHVSGFTLD